MQWLALVGIIILFAVFGGNCSSSFPREDGKWSQKLYDKHHALCVKAYRDSALCNCAVASTENIMSFDQALLLEEQPNAGDPARNEVFKKVAEGAAWCRTPEGLKNNPAARANATVRTSTEPVRDGVNHNVKFDSKSGKWSNR